jgi:hypothetical protein
MEIRKVCSDEKKIISEITEIHLKTFPGFFLTFMGRGFLRQMYSAYSKHSQSGVFVAEDEGGVIGFLDVEPNNLLWSLI